MRATRRERLLALALGWQDALALSAEIAGRLNTPSLVFVPGSKVEGLDDAHQRATVGRAASPSTGSGRNGET